MGGRGTSRWTRSPKEAGVGIGTLYRHFPTREALIEATYRNELARLCDAADELLDNPGGRRMRCASGWTGSSTT